MLFLFLTLSFSLNIDSIIGDSCPAPAGLLVVSQVVLQGEFGGSQSQGLKTLNCRFQEREKGVLAGKNERSRFCDATYHIRPRRNTC